MFRIFNKLIINKNGEKQEVVRTRGIRMTEKEVRQFIADENLKIVKINQKYKKNYPSCEVYETPCAFEKFSGSIQEV